MPPKRTGKRRPPAATSAAAAARRAKRPRNDARCAATASSLATTTNTTTTHPFSSSSGKASRRGPNLSQLPYHILLDIFLFASHGNFVHGWPNCTCLAALARTCKNFYEPAISALYRNPPTAPPVRAHQLLRRLRERPELGSKVKRLVLDIDPLLKLSTAGYGRFDAGEFVSLCSGIKEVWISHPWDLPPYRWDTNIPPHWKYPQELFDALEGGAPKRADGEAEETARTPIRLHGWRWNHLFTDIEHVAHRHLQPSFQTLRRLSIIYILDPLLDFGPALAVLPHLEDLELERCSFRPAILSGIATAAPALRLKSLSLINCGELESLSLSELLRSRTCGQLEHLQVASCRSCDLAFLSALSHTPNLLTLHFEGKYFSTTAIYNDAKPGYQTLLPLDSMPLYPPNLRSLKLLNLRKWSAEEVEAFLDSLVSAAPRLRRMRELSLHCILDGFGWRERAGVRDKYEPKLLHAFVRPPSEPTPFQHPSPPEPQPDIRQRRSVRSREKSLTRETGGSTATVAAAAAAASSSFSSSFSLFRGFAEPDKVDLKFDNARPTGLFTLALALAAFIYSRQKPISMRMILWTTRGVCRSS